jgi:hypothetical protein
LIDERIDFRRDEFLQGAARFFVVGGEEHGSIFSSSFRGARSASPESILIIVVMDSGLAASRRPGMTAEGERHP